MNTAWARFARRRLALSHWQCEPEALGPADRERFARSLQHQLNLEQAVVEAAQRRGLTVTPEALASVAKSLASEFPAEGFSQQERDAVAYHHALMEYQLQFIGQQAQPPDAATVEAWYQRHQAHFMRPEQRLTHHLLLTVDDDREVVLSTVRQFHRQIADSRQAFAGLARRHSQCPSALEDGRLGWVGRGLLYPELDAVLFALAENGLSEPVESELGWHLLWCQAIRPPKAMARDAALAKARAYLWQQRQQQRQRQWLATLSA